jgi:hypothetical protein
MKKRAGVTLIELVITIALLSFVLIGVVDMFLLATTTHGKTFDEFNIQSNVRIASQKFNTIIRDSSAVFLLEKEYPDPSMIESYLTEGWNYIMLNEDKTKLIEWAWDEDAKLHKERTLIDAAPNVSYEIVYNKDSAPDEDKLLEYTLDVNVNGVKRTITSQLEGVNTLQIIDRSYGGVANAIAYREDPRITNVAVAQAAVSFVVDKSGSMGDYLTGRTTKLAVLKDEATKMIEGLSSHENIYLSISPFATTANSTASENTNKMLHLKSNKNMFINNSNSIINKLSANGGTNTGDGMRRGLSTIVEFNDRSENQDKTTKNFMIILVDGDTTFATATERVNTTYTETNRDPNNKGTITLNPGTENERVYTHTRTTSTRRGNSYSGYYYEYTHTYSCGGSNRITYYTTLHENVGDYDISGRSPLFGFQENDYKPRGKVIGNGSSYDTTYGKPYVNLIGQMIKDYRNTREDGIDVFIIGFSSSASPTGLQDLANATKSTHGTHGGTYKYYKADTAEALETVLNEIKFQISDALWHIGGPN